MSLYNLKSADGDWRITKYDNDLNPEGSYLVSADACTCPAGARPTCRHRQMLPKFLAAGAEDSGMFFHFETEQFLTPDLGESNSSSDLAETDDSSADSEVLEGEILEPNSILTLEEFGNRLMAKDITPSPYPYTEETCPGHVASNDNPKVCGRCGTHIDSLRPDDDIVSEALPESGSTWQDKWKSTSKELFPNKPVAETYTADQISEMRSIVATSEPIKPSNHPQGTIRRRL